MTDRYESRASTHAHDCWSWGPGHYKCAVMKIERLRQQRDELLTALQQAEHAARIHAETIKEMQRAHAERFEIVGLTKAEADRCMEVLCGGPVPWDRGYCFASSELFARPSRYGPEPSNEGRKPMSDESERLQRRVAELEHAARIHAETIRNMQRERS